VVENGTARRREIAVGVSSGDLLEVKAGVKAGEQFVVRGGFNLKDGDRITAAASK
jgi:multidrug efflux pump subunit AcrA (membrane-fusion protein)